MKTARGPGSILRVVKAALLAVIAAAGPALSQQREPGPTTPARLPSQFALDSWDDRSGLPQNSVQAIAQTTDGYIWLGTQQGLARFDGVRFSVFDRQSTPSLPTPYVWALAADREGGLWIGTEEGGLSYLADGRIVSYAEGLPSKWVQALHVDNAGAVWIGTRGGGLARLRDGRIDTVAAVSSGVAPKNVWSIEQDAAGAVWVGFGGGLSRMTPAGPVTLRAADGLPGGAALALAAAPGGGMWVGMNGGLALVQGDSVVRTWTAADGLPAAPVYRLRAGDDGTLWIGTAAGLARLVDGVVTTFDPAAFPRLADVMSLETDHEGSVWVGTNSGGLSRVRGTPFMPLGRPEGLSEDMVFPVLQDRHGRMWIGSMGGLDRLDGDDVAHFDSGTGHLPDDVVFSLVEAADGAIWAGTNGGVARLDGASSRSWTAADGMTGQARALAFDERGVLWVGTNEGLRRLLPGPPRTFTTADGLPDDFILTVVPARDGGLWIGTRAGLTRLVGRGFRSWPVPGGVGAIRQDADGTVWMGGQQGLARLQAGRMVHADLDDGLCDELVGSVVADRRGRLWLGSNRGIFMVQRSEFDAFADQGTPLPCRLFGRAHGMRSREVNAAVTPAAWRATDGRLWFPTLAGIVVVDPENLETGLVAPPVMIEGLVADGVAPGTLPTRLEAGTRSLGIDFTAATFVSPDQVRFRYRLDGVDRDWVEVVNRRRVSYRNLRPGHYTFRVMAANAEGDWNEVGAAHTFTILPLFWETGAFRAAALLALVAVLALLYRRRVRRLQLRQDELLQLVDERTHAEARYRGLFENAADAVFTTDLEGRFTAMNRRAEELTGYGAADMDRLNVRGLLPPSDAGERVAREWLAGTADGARTVEIIARDGTRIPVEVSTRIVHDGDVPVGIQALARDVRDRAALERQLRQSQKMQAVGQLAGGIAHDFNNLLTVIRGNGELLLAQPGAGDDRADLEQIVAAAERASALTRQLLSFSRQQVVQPVTVNVNELVRGLERMLHRLIGEDIRIELSLTEEDAWVNADPGQLEQVLVNLAVNARDAMPRGGTLTIATTIIPVDDVPHAPVVTETGRCLLLTVTDTGLGMDAPTMSRIFEPFFTTKDAGKGTGLGLSTVYGIVEQAGGQILCQSEPGRGTVFRIYLPARAAGTTGKAVTGAPRIGNWRGTETILLVEDDAAVRALTWRILTRFGYSVLETGDGATALRIADDHPGPIHLVLTDMVMPAMNGREVAERLRALRKDVRVLLMSGYTDDEILRRGMHDPVTAFLQKPFTPDDLGRAVRDALDREPAARRTA